MINRCQPQLINLKTKINNMETMSFTLGVLSVIIAAFVVVLVWGVVKVVKHGKQIEENNKWVNSSHNDIWRGREEDRRINYEREQNLHRDIDSRFEELSRRLDQSESEMYRQINDQAADAVTQSKSHTDSRIDKLIDAYFETVGSKKQIIKG